MCIMDKSAKIKADATTLIEDKALNQLLSKYGEVVFTGSYATDLMVWPDIDIQLVMPNEMSKLDQILALGRECLMDSEVKNIKLINFSVTQKPGMPRGMYLGMKVKPKTGSTAWKIDIWALEQKDFETSHAFTQEVKQKLTPALKKLIIEWKFRLMGTAERVPQLGSYYLYQAILINQLQDDNAILAYLQDNGVAV